MFDIGAQEILIILVVAVLVIGPKDLPLAMRTAGRWLGKMRRLSGHFRSGIETMIREAEMEDMEKKWKEQNERIMAEHPADAMQPINSETMAPPGIGKADTAAAQPPAAGAEAKLPEPPEAEAGEKPAKPDEPQLPLGNSGG